MRALLAVIAVAILAGCASTSTGNTATVYDRKYNAYQATRQSESDFVGAGAKAGELAKAKPSWYVRGHP